MVLRGACDRSSDCLAEEVRMGRDGNLDAGTINRAIALITRPEVPFSTGI